MPQWSFFISRRKNTYILVYILWPFCWFCKRVFARSIGNTQVTPISPAIPPLINLAGKLREKEMDKPNLKKKMAGKGTTGFIRFIFTLATKWEHLFLTLPDNVMLYCHPPPHPPQIFSQAAEYNFSCFLSAIKMCFPVSRGESMHFDEH